MSIVLGRQLGVAVCEVIGIDCKKTPVIDVGMSAKRDEVACINLCIALAPGMLSEIEARLAAITGEKS